MKQLILKHKPDHWLMEGKLGAALASRLARSQYGYASENVMTRVANPGKILREGEDAVFRSRSARNREMIVLRGPSEQRLRWLKGLKGWADGKPEWIKAKSKMGWLGIVGIPKTPEIEAVVAKGARSNYPMGNLKGAFPEMDDFIAQNPTRPAYEVPYGEKMTVNGSKVFDWDAAGSKYALAKGAKLVDVGDRYIVVGALGRPILQDLDLGSIYKFGTSSPGSHLPSGRGNPEDHFLAEEVMNYEFFKATGEVYNPIKHGGAGGSARHAVEGRKAGKPHWTPRQGTGFIDEELYVYLPVRRGAELEQ